MLYWRISFTWRQIFEKTYSFLLQAWQWARALCFDNEHERYVYTCKGHPFLISQLEGMCNECYCKNIGPFEMCKFCVQMRYLLNFRYYKFCVEEIPKWLNKFLVPLDSYLEHETLKCESFFYFWNNKVCGSLHNPLLDDMKDKKNPAN